jgi:glycosyltransferase involved in cell wall biosynthesis
MRVVQITPQIDNLADGMAYSVPRLASALAGRGVDTTLMTLGQGARQVDGVNVERFEASPKKILSRLGASDGLRRAIRDKLRSADVFHAHGLWQMTSIYPTTINGSQSMTIVSPRGMLGAEALEFSKWRKKAFWWWAQKAALERCAALHATSRDEYEAIRAAGISRPVAVIPNAIDLPDLEALPEGQRSRTVISLGRLHPKKGLDRLVRAWGELEAEFPDWQLRLIGPNEGNYREELEELARQLALKHVSIEQPLFGEQKWTALRSAELFVLPTLNENFALTVAEALACETPVIATKGAPWSGLDQKQCGWWIDHGPDRLAAALRYAMRLEDEQRRAMGRRGREWMAQDFSWEAVAVSMHDVYLWVRGQAPRPGTVFG